MHAAEVPPIACTLEPAALRERLELIRRVTNQSLLNHRLDGNTLHLFYRPTAQADVRAIMEAERECCAFLGFDLVETPDVVELRIEAPGGIGLDARWLFDQFLPAAAAVGAANPCGCGSRGCG
jgi:hypothetical protein